MSTLLQRTLKNSNEKNIPIWFMRQAGRYLPEYREVREKYSFEEMTSTPDIAAKITLQPIERFDLDAAIIFADIMTLLGGMGINVSFAKGPPELDFTYEGTKTIAFLKERATRENFDEHLSYFRESLRLTRKNLKPEKSLIGFAAAPFTLASYLVEGTTSKTHNKTRAYLYAQSDEFQQLLDAIAEATIHYLLMQKDAGADVVQLFESWGDVNHPRVYSEIILPSIVKVVKAVSPHMPVIFYSRGASVLRETLLPLYDAGVSAVSVDWRMEIDFFGNRPVQGNLDPALLESTPEAVRREALSILNRRGKTPGLVFNLGHGISPQANLAAVEAMVSTVKEFSF